MEHRHEWRLHSEPDGDERGVEHEERGQRQQRILIQTPNFSERVSLSYRGAHRGREGVVPARPSAMGTRAAARATSPGQSASTRTKVTQARRLARAPHTITCARVEATTKCVRTWLWWLWPQGHASAASGCTTVPAIVPLDFPSSIGSRNGGRGHVIFAHSQEDVDLSFETLPIEAPFYRWSVAISSQSDRFIGLRIKTKAAGFNVTAVQSEWTNGYFAKWVVPIDMILSAVAAASAASSCRASLCSR